VSDRLTWRNHSGDQVCHPLTIAHPATTEELVELVRLGMRVRAVGAGHAWSDVALTDGCLIETDRLSGLLDLDDGTLRARALDPATHVRVRGGTRVRELNDLLHARGQALRNMGGYDHQSIAGVVSTSTHGSGVGFGPFPDVVRSLDLVVARGERVRVEPADGPTDPARFAARHGDKRRLEQDDALFAAAICAFGCMGIIEALVLEVRAAFRLHETRTVRTWERVREELTEGILDRYEHYELFLNPYPRGDGEHELLVTTRTPPEPGDAPSPGDGMRHPLIELESSFFLIWVALRLAARLRPAFFRSQFARTLRRMEDPNYTQASYRVFNIGAANRLPAYSMELGVPAEGDNHLRTVDRIIEIAGRCAERGWYHTSPIALRFVAPSAALASMMHGARTMMIELILVLGTRHGHELLQTYERELADLGSRPHWGQYNTLGPGDPARLYPGWDAWMAAYERFNADGAFDNEFTDRIGISRRNG
jgi:L-gulono-1,4-lactone dehydrogenase